MREDRRGVACAPAAATGSSSWQCVPKLRWTGGGSTGRYAKPAGDLSTSSGKPMTGRTITAEEVLRRELEDESFRAEWERTAFARAVALRVVGFRAEHRLSQAALGRLLGMAQSGVARLEAGEHVPTLETMRRLARALGTSFLVEVDPGGGLQLLDRAV